MKVRAEFKFNGEHYLFHLDTNDAEESLHPYHTWVVENEDGSRFEIDIFRNDMKNDEWLWESDTEICGNVLYFPPNSDCDVWTEPTLLTVEG